MRVLAALLAHRRRTLAALGLAALIAVVVGGWPRPERVAANPLTGIASISAGNAHTCAVTTGGGVKCWGRNASGELGDGTQTDRHVPTDAVGLGSGVASTAAGGGNIYGHTCALTSAGGAKCWGNNYAGELGDGTTTSSAIPVNVTSISGVTAVDTGGLQSCAIVSGGAVYCWGGIHGAIPTVVVAGGAAAIAVGAAHVCDLTTTGGVNCSGLNFAGQLGDGSLTSGIAAIAAGDEFTCALTVAGGVKCWGSNTQGQVGDGQACGSISCSAPIDVVGLTSGVVALSAGGFHACAVTTAGAVRCWGSNLNGQLGDGTSTTRTTPVSVVGLTSGITSVSAGTFHTCARTGGGNVKCWGSNGYGELGDGATSTRSTTPVDVVGFAKPTPTATACPPPNCPTPIPTPAAPYEMQLRTQDATCDNAARPVKCSVRTGRQFTLLVDVTRAPSQGYVALQSFVDYAAYLPAASEDGGGPGTCGNGIDDGDGYGADRLDLECYEVNLVYKPAPDGHTEFVWPDLGGIVYRGSRGPGLVNHAGVTSLVPPYPVSHFEGTVTRLTMTCSTYPSQTTVRLLPYNPADLVAYTDGALFVLPDSTQLAANPDSLTINCVAQPPSLGGVAEYPDVAGGPGGGVIAAVAGAMAAAFAAGGAAWYARRRYAPAEQRGSARV